MAARTRSAYFQDPCTPIMESLVDLHTLIMFFLVGIIVLVVTALWLVVIEFGFNLKFYDKIEQLQVVKVIHCTWLELVWTLTPLWVLITIALPSFALLYAMEEKTDFPLTIKTVGHQWYWEYQYAVATDWFTQVLSWDISLDDLFFNYDSYMLADQDLNLGQFRLLEVDRKVLFPLEVSLRVLTTSSDVIHSFALPSAGIKMDAVPGRLNQVNTFFNRSGVFYGQCSELCGVNHGFMPITVKVLNLIDYFSFVVRQFSPLANNNIHG